MSINTLNKRASCIGIDLMWLRVYAKPDGSIVAADRNQIGMKYAGIVTAGANTNTGFTFYRTLMGVGG
jgi:hypothetical protein